ncbi:MAG: (E)-4-hydroxy-3-methylbut-2-enyl-diphosphate synthase [Bacteroidales bacterium]
MKKRHSYPLPRSSEICIGDLKMGGRQPVVVQSMANTPTTDLSGSVEQFKRIVDAGSQMVRFTTQGLREVEALRKIIDALPPNYRKVPVVADVHFRSDIALNAAQICHKVRINPGNFTEKKQGPAIYSEEQFLAGLAENRTAFVALINECKKHNTTIRIGVNHGSLSKRIMSSYGNTPEGMVESSLEFLRICREENFHHVVVSLKSSNSVLMIHAVRLLQKQMAKENLCYPIHLGVTESGNGMDGRIKSVVGMAPLLAEGIGDTIRVSLTEPPENEIPVALAITRIFKKPELLPYDPVGKLPWNPFDFNKSKAREVLGIGGANPPVVVLAEGVFGNLVPDITASTENNRMVLSYNGSKYVLEDHRTTLLSVPGFLIAGPETEPGEIVGIKQNVILILDAGRHELAEVKQWMIDYLNQGGSAPVILRKRYSEKEEEHFMIRAAGEFALLLVDQLLDGIWIENPDMTPEFNSRLSFSILQASRNRITSTEYIACPSCGRTKFDIESVLEEVKAKTSHLKGLKIGVMGCVVNGPGKMADADYGYVGVGKGLVTIYKEKEAIAKNIHAGDAVDQLISVIKKHGNWIDP